MGFHFDLLIFFGLIFAEVTAVAGVAYLIVRFALRGALRVARRRSERPDASR